LTQCDFENAKQLFILTRISNTYDVSGDDLKVKNLFSYNSNKITVMCEFETLYSYFHK